MVGVQTVLPAPESTPRQHRRHLAGLAVGALVLLAGAATVVGHATTYAASTTVVLVGSPSVDELEVSTGRVIDPTAQSELARFGDTTVVGDIFARVYRTHAKYDELVKAGLQGQLTVTTKRAVLSDAPDHGPVLVFTVVAPSPAAAVTGTAIVVDDLQRELGRRQAGADPALTVTAAVVARPDRALPVKGSRVRAAVAFFALALLVGWLTNIAVAARRRRMG